MGLTSNWLAGRRTGRFGLLLAGLAAASALTAPALAQRTFYVDYAGGRDDADGLSPASAWKHAPGDTQAEGRARSTQLAAGDRVLFRGGVRYRGQIIVRRGGAPGNPVVFDGSSWGDKKAIFDGSTALANVRRCPSQAACLGAPHWQRMWMGDLPAGAKWTDWLFERDQPMQLSQWPAIPDSWSYDDVQHYVAVPQAQLSQVQAGFLPAPGVPARLAAGSPVLALWHNSNDIAFTQTMTVRPDGVAFDAPGFRPWTGRDNRFAVMNAPSEVAAPGQFAIDNARGVALFIPQARTNLAPNVAVGSRRYGFLLSNGVGHVDIRGISFTSFAADSMGGSDNRAGNAIQSESGAAHVRVLDNDFRAIVSMKRLGAVRFVRPGPIEIRRNRFENMPWATAIYVSFGEGPVTVACNHISRIGRNGVRVVTMKNATVAGNHIEFLPGIHATGINVYRDNRFIRVLDNVVVDADQPFTAHGDGGNPWFSTSEPQDVLLRGNVMINRLSSGSAVSSWGLNMRSLKLHENFLSSGRFAVALSDRETGVEIVRNRMVGRIAGSTGIVRNEGNTILDPNSNGQLVTAEMRSARPPQSYCS